jgi:large subunit ribosomal protein L10
MNRQEKSEIIKYLVDQFKNHDCFYIVDATRLSVSAIDQFRRSCYNAGINYKVAKNTLVLKALDELPHMSKASETLKDEVLKGFTGILFINENASAPAKLVAAFREQKSLDRPILKGAYIDGELFVGDDKLEVLSKLKSKQVLIGEIITLLKSPMANVLSALQSSKSQLAGIIKTLGDRKE